MDKRESVLFVCIHNSARSQMAEAFLKFYSSGLFRVESAGIEPGRLNPFVVEAMKEVGIDISGNRTKSVFEFLDKGQQFDYVITVCDETSAERCPVFPGQKERLHWGFEDPSSLKGDSEEVLAGVRRIRDEIKERILKWLETKGVGYAGQFVKKPVV